MPMSDALKGLSGTIGDHKDFIEQVREAAAGRGGKGGRRVPKGVDPRLARDAIRQLIDAFVKISFSIVVPGSHGSGLSNQELLGYLAEGGRDFTQVSNPLRAFIKARLQQVHLNANVVPLRLDLEETRREAVVEFLQARMLRKVRDVAIRSLLASTVKKKRAAGYSNPALPGYATGELHDNLARLRVVEGR